MRRLLAILMMLMLIGAESVQAVPFDEQEMAVYQEALVWWGATPAGCSGIDFQTVARTELQANALGEATQPEPGEYKLCKLWVADDLESCELPAIMRHEVGHLLGYGHSPDPDNIMYPAPPQWWCTAEQLRRELRGVERSLPKEQHLCRTYPQREECPWSLRLLKIERHRTRRELEHVTLMMLAPT